jgi:hypothetical protein
MLAQYPPYLLLAQQNLRQYHLRFATVVIAFYLSQLFTPPFEG